MNPFYLSKPYDPPTPPEILPLEEPWALLGGNSPQQFMQCYWHKKPLLIRKAIPAFSIAKNQGQPLGSPISAQNLFKIAGNREMEARLIQSKPWSVSSGPFQKKTLPASGSPNWTLLLQGMEAWHPAAATVLSWFRFIPDARLDDLMISIAGIGGGVGPHFDSYDVFLMQMQGRRRWRVSQQTDFSLIPDLPLKILQNFKQEQEWDLEPGDMLYLPPHVAHDGIALDNGCQTWSIGFRSPSYRELLQEGLWRLAESLEDLPELAKRFSDPQQAATPKPDEIPELLMEQLRDKLHSLHLAKVETFLPGIAAYLSEPKVQAIFSSPKHIFSPAKCNQQLQQTSLRPHPQSRLIRLGEHIFCNGENMTQGQSASIRKAWQTLSAQKYLGPSNSMSSIKDSSLYTAYCDGWLIFEPASDR